MNKSKSKSIQLKPNQILCKTEKGKPVVVTIAKARLRSSFKNFEYRPFRKGDS